MLARDVWSAVYAHGAEGSTDRREQGATVMSRWLDAMRILSSGLGGRRIRDPYDGARYLFAGGAFQLALIAADLVGHVGAHDEIGRFQGLLFDRAAGVLFTRRGEGKIVLLIFVVLVGGSGRLEILQRGDALDLRRGRRDRDCHYDDRN